MVMMKEEHRWGATYSKVAAGEMNSVFPYSGFISHTWDKEKNVGRDNHARVKQLNENLQRFGFTTWFNDEQMRSNMAIF